MTNAMEQTHSETDSRSDIQGIMHHLRNPNFHYRVHRNPPLVLIPS